jgi:hypothetical protein
MSQGGPAEDFFANFKSTVSFATLHTEVNSVLMIRERRR